jgi:CheY-like chemotaxis protein
VRLRETDDRHWQCASCRARVDGEGRWVELSVADSGCGIAPDVLERMFDPFYTTKEIGRGSGMGLAMVHGIVHEHGGHIRVDSRAGAGSVFRVMLPPAATGALAPAPAAAAAPPSHVAALSGRVMLVEDEAMVGEFMCELLDSWGLDVLFERDPLRAVAWIEQPSNALDLMITDRTMPHLTGLELAERVRALRPSLPVLLFTGDATAFDGAELKRRGVDAVLRKPVAPDELRTALRQLLKPASDA